SLSKEKRLDAETRLKEGRLKALVATASLELGIDIGAVDLVCQIGSTRSIATLLQRVGRSGHHLAAVPKGRVFPLSRDELIECAALLRAARERELDRLIIPDHPLDILAQQVVAAVECEEWDEAALYELVRGAYPYRDLPRKDFDAVVQMLADGITTRRGRRGAYVHYDGVNRRLKDRRSTRAHARAVGAGVAAAPGHREPAGEYDRRARLARRRGPRPARGRGAAGRRVSRRVAQDPRRHSHTTDAGAGALLRRSGGDAAGAARAVREPGESRLGPGVAQAVLPQLQLRAAGGRHRGCHRDLPRAAP